MIGPGSDNNESNARKVYRIFQVIAVEKQVPASQSDPTESMNVTR